MESLYLDISDYLPDEEVEAVERALRKMPEEYDFIPSKMNEPPRKSGRKKKGEAQPLQVFSS